MKRIELKDLVINQFTWDILDSNCYVLKEKGSTLIVDPIDLDDFYRFIEYSDRALIILSHAHYDHICGLNKVREIIPNTTVLCSKSCSINIQDPKKNLSNIANAMLAFHEKREQRNEVESFSCHAADMIYEKMLKVEWENHNLTLMEFHGHSPDSQIILFDEKLLFSGDTLLSNPTITRLPGGNRRAFYEEDIPRLEKLEVEKVLPGHGNVGRIQDMIKINKQN